MKVKFLFLLAFGLSLSGCEEFVKRAKGEQSGEIVVVPNGIEGNHRLYNSVVADVSKNNILNSHLMQDQGLVPIQSDLKSVDPTFATLEGLVIDWMVVDQNGVSVFRVHSEKGSLPCQYLEQNLDRTYRCSGRFLEMAEDLISAPTILPEGLLFLRDSGELIFSPDFVEKKIVSSSISSFWLVGEGRILAKSKPGTYSLLDLFANQSAYDFDLRSDEQLIVFNGKTVLRVRKVERLLQVAEWNETSREWRTIAERDVGSARLASDGLIVRKDVVFISLSKPDLLLAFDGLSLKVVHSGSRSQLNVSDTFVSFTTQEDMIRICFQEENLWKCSELKLPEKRKIYSHLVSPEGSLVITRSTNLPDVEGSSSNIANWLVSELLVLSTDQLVKGESRLLRREVLAGEVQRLRILDGKPKINEVSPQEDSDDL